MTHESPYAANTERLSGKQWLIAAILLVAVFFILPRAWSRLEPFNPNSNYRLPYSLNNDYWMYQVWSRYAAKNADILLVGDSVIWGDYVRRDATLNCCLNRLQTGPGRLRFANLGVDGIHPAATAGLLKYYGSGLAGKKIILQFNFLWMTSPETDLRGKDEARINHPQLIPQFWPWIASYKAPIEERLSNVIKSHVPLFNLTSHLRTLYFDSLDLQSWTVNNPYKWPLDAITFKIPEPEMEVRGNIKPVPWTESGLVKQNFTWVKADDSFQFASFRKALETLRARGNDVFVIVTPFNVHMLTDESRQHYREVRENVDSCLKKTGTLYHIFADLASEEYGDASHPLTTGYKKMAQALLENPSFQKWAGTAPAVTTDI